MIPFAQPTVGDEERAAVAAVLSGKTLTRGPQVVAFETAFSDFCGGGMAVAVSSCMAALHLGLMAVGVRPKTEVIVPAMTHPAVAHAVELMGAKPIFLDAAKPDGNVPAEAIANAIGEDTSCITLVHFLGKLAHPDEVRGIALKKSIPVIEDCALALGARNQHGGHAGLLTHGGCFSFYPTKHMTTGEGGMFLTRHAAIGQDVVSRRSFGYHAIATTPHQTGSLRPGLNYRMTEMQAAMGIEQLKRVPGFLEHRYRNYMRYAVNLADFEHIESGGGAYYGFSVVVPEGKDRDAIRAAMKTHGVETSVHYHHVVPLMPYYMAKYGYAPGQFPVAEWIAERTIALPLGPHMSAQKIDLVSDLFKKAIHNNG